MASTDFAQEHEPSLVDPGGVKVLSKRKICEFCEKSFHRNSLKRHQKICSGNLWIGEQNKVYCFKENDSQKNQERTKAEDGKYSSSYPPKLQIANVTDVKSSADVNTLLDPPKLQSVQDHNNKSGLPRLCDGEPIPIPVTKKLRRYSSYKNSSRKSQSADLVFVEVEKEFEGKERISAASETLLKNDRVAERKSVTTAINNANSRIRSKDAQKSKYENLRTSSRLEELCSKPKNIQPSSQSSLPLPASQKRPSITKNSKHTKKVKSDPIILVEAVPTKCLGCDAECDTHSELISHGLIHIKEGILICLQCSNKKIDNLDLHFKSEHQSEKKKENCELCNKSVDKNNSFYHYKEHHSLAKNLKCNLCDQKFSFMQNLLYHKSNEHLREAVNSKFCQRNGDMMKIKNSQDENTEGGKQNKTDSISLGPASLSTVGKGNPTNGIKSKYARYGASNRINVKTVPSNSVETKFSNEIVFEDAVDSQGSKMDGASIFSHSPTANSESDNHFVNEGFTDICGIFISTTNAKLSNSESLSSSGKSYYDSVSGLFTDVEVSKRLTRISVESGESSRSSYSSISSTNSKIEIDCNIVSPSKQDFMDGIAAAKISKTVQDCSVVLQKCDSEATTNSSNQDNDETSNDSAINSMQSDWSKSDFLISSNKEYTCRLCENSHFGSTLEYLTHLKTEHHWTEGNLLNPEYEPDYWCPECGLEFIVRPTLVKHLIIAHEEIPDVEEYMECLGYGMRPLMKYQCSVCYSVFPSDQELCSHRRCHGLAYLQFLTTSNSVK